MLHICLLLKIVLVQHEEQDHQHSELNETNN